MASRVSKIKVPPSELAKLRLFSQLSGEDLQGLKAALSQEQPNVDGDALARAVAKQTRISFSDIREVISVLWGLAILQRRIGIPIDPFVDLLLKNLSELDEDNWGREDNRRISEKREDLASLLSPDGIIAFSAKAGELLTEQNNVFCRSHIVTDIRPVFDEKAEQIQGFVPFHMLAITYHEGDETNTSYFALDYSDLLSMRQQIDRAEQKEKLLRDTLKDTGITIIQTGANPNV